MRFPLRLASIFAFAALSSCGGCQKGGGEARRWVGKDAEAILEVRDLSLLVRTRQKLLANFGSVVTSQQVEGLQQEVTLRLGFDPSTPDGLAAAGLPPSGSVAVELKDGGSSALWVVPVADGKKFAATLDKVVRARATVDEVTQEKVEGQELTAFVSAFGAEKVAIATYTLHQGFGLVGVGSQGKAMVLAAVTRKPEAAIEAHPEYQAQVQALGSSWEARLISPSGALALQGALRTASRALPLRGLDQHPDLARLSSAGWALDFSGNTAKVQGRLRLDAEGLQKSKALFASRGAPAAGVLAVDLPRAALFLQVAGSVPGLLEAIAPAGSPPRAKLEALYAKLKSDLSTDVEKEVLPILSGHAAIALGLGDLSGRGFEVLMQNPLGLLWSAAAIGVDDPSALLAVERRLDPGLTAQGLQIGSRDVGAVKIRSVTQSIGGTPATLVESFGREKAMILANEPVIADQLATSVGKDRLGGQPGLALELRFTEVSRALAAVDLGSAPLLFRSMIAKGMETLASLDVLTVKVRPTEDGIGMEATLQARVGTGP